MTPKKPGKLGVIEKVWVGSAGIIPAAQARPIDIKSKQKIFACAECLKEGDVLAGLFVNGEKVQVKGFNVKKDMINGPAGSRIVWFNFPAKNVTKTGKYDIIIKTAPNDGTLTDENKIQWEKDSFVGEINYLK